jgi:hypothetical protein
MRARPAPLNECGHLPALPSIPGQACAFRGKKAPGRPVGVPTGDQAFTGRARRPFSLLMASDGDDLASAVKDRRPPPRHEEDRELAGWTLAVILELEADVDP